MMESANIILKDKQEEAEDILSQGIAMAAGDAMTGITQALSGLATGGGAMSQSGASYQESMQNLSMGQGFSQVFGGLGSMVKGAPDIMGKEYESEAKRKEADATKQSAYSDSTRSIFEEEKQLQGDIMQVLNQIEQAQHDTQSAVISKV